MLSLDHADKDEGQKDAAAEAPFSDGEEAGPFEEEEEECMSDVEDNCSDEEDELGGTQVNVDITRARRLWTLREGTFEGVDGAYYSDDGNGTPAWRARAKGTAGACKDASDSEHPSEAEGHVVEAAGQTASGADAAVVSNIVASAEVSAASTPDTEGRGGRFVDAKDKPDENQDGSLSVQGALVVSRAPSNEKVRYQYSLSPRPLTDARVIAEAHAPTYGPSSISRSSSTASGDEYGFYAAQGEVHRITADDGFDLEEALALQEGGLFTDRQRRWMKIPDGDPGPCSPCNRPASALPAKQRKGKRHKWRSPFWVPFSVIVAALPACDSPQVPMARVHQDDVKRKHMEAKVAECERAAAKAVAQGRFMGAIEAVETNIRHRARGGLESPSQLLCMLQATAFLCGAYAVECIHRKQLEEAEALLEHAEGLTRKGVLKKCRETDLVRCGLRAATFNVNALLHRQMGEQSKSFRMLQRALKIARQKQGLEVMEAATLINMGSVLMSQGQLPDAVTIVGASLSLLSKHELEAAMAWESEASLHHHISAGDVPSAEAGGRAGRSARINAIWAMVAMSHHNRGAMHEAARRSDSARHDYERALEIAQQYLGPTSHIATGIAAALSAQQPGSPGAKGGGDAAKPSPARLLVSSAGKPQLNTPGDGPGALQNTRKRPEAVQVRSPDTVHRTLVESCGYVHWGHAPTGLRHKNVRDERLKNGAGSKAGTTGNILPTLLYFDESPRIDGLGLPAPLVSKIGGGPRPATGTAHALGGAERFPIKGRDASGEGMSIAGVAAHVLAGDAEVVRADADLMGRAGPRKYRSDKGGAMTLVRSLSCPVSESPSKTKDGGIEKCLLQARGPVAKTGEGSSTKPLPQVRKTLQAASAGGGASVLQREKTPQNPRAGVSACAADAELALAQSFGANIADQSSAEHSKGGGREGHEPGLGAGGPVGREAGHAVERALEKRPAMLSGNGALFNALAFPSGRAAGGGGRGHERAKEGDRRREPSWAGVGSAAGARAAKEAADGRGDGGESGKGAKTAGGGSIKGRVQLHDAAVEDTLAFLLGKGSCGALRISTAGACVPSAPAHRPPDVPPPHAEVGAWQAVLGGTGTEMLMQAEQPGWGRLPSSRSDSSRGGASYSELVQRGEREHMKTLEREADERVRRLLGEPAADGEGKAYLHAGEGQAPARGARRDRSGAEQLALVPFDCHEPSSEAPKAGGAGGAGGDGGGSVVCEHTPQLLHVQRHPRLRRRPPPPQQQQQRAHPEAQQQPSGFLQWCGRGSGPQMIPRPPASAGREEKRRNGVETVQLLLNRVNKSRGVTDASGSAPVPVTQCDSLKPCADSEDLLRIVCSQQAAPGHRSDVGAQDDGAVRASWHAGLGVHRDGDVSATLRGGEERVDNGRRGLPMKSKAGYQGGNVLRVLPDVSGASRAAVAPDVKQAGISRGQDAASRQVVVRASLPR